MPVLRVTGIPDGARLYVARRDYAPDTGLLVEERERCNDVIREPCVEPGTVDFGVDNGDFLVVKCRKVGRRPFETEVRVPPDPEWDHTVTVQVTMALDLTVNLRVRSADEFRRTSAQIAARAGQIIGRLGGRSVAAEVERATRPRRSVGELVAVRLEGWRERVEEWERERRPPPEPARVTGVRDLDFEPDGWLVATRCKLERMLKRRRRA